MNKNLLFTAMLGLAIGGSAQAQDLSGHTLYDFGNTVWEDADGYQNEYLFGSFNKVSANGKYAVGYDDQMLFTTFMWTNETPGEIEIINNDYNKAIYLCDVTNDGVAVGGYEESANAGMYPAYMTLDKEWTVLPVPENTSSQAAVRMQDDLARAITPNGSHIAGQVYIVTGETTSPFDGSIVEQRALIPCLWTKNGDAYELTAYPELGAAGQSYLYNTDTETFDVVEQEVNDNTFFIYDISNDGSTIVGMNTSDTGGQNPMFIRDGKLYQIYDCANDANYTFNGGVCSSIDANGNIYGYFTDDFETTTYFVLTADNKLEYTDTWYVCGNAKGERYAQSNGSLPYTLDCSEDGAVVVGGGITAMGFGVLNTPSLLYNEALSGVNRIEAIKNNVGINYNGYTLCITGEYNTADIYNLSGVRIATGGQGRAFNLGNQPAGAYIVKVTTDNGVKTFKIAK